MQLGMTQSACNGRPATAATLAFPRSIFKSITGALRMFTSTRECLGSDDKCEIIAWSGMSGSPFAVRVAVKLNSFNDTGLWCDRAAMSRLQTSLILSSKEKPPTFGT